MSKAEIATEYQGPVTTATITIAGRPVVVVRPVDPDRLLDDPDVLAWNRREDYMPYWAYLWPGAFLLAEAVAAEPWGNTGDVLEIGCGLGLAGLVALSRGLHVTFTDYDEAPLDFVARSAAASGFDPGSFATARLDWRTPTAGRFGVILGADLLYEQRLVPLVADVLAAKLEAGGLALIADPYRVAAEGFAAAVEARGLTCEAVPVSAESAELGPVRGTIYRVTSA